MLKNTFRHIPGVGPRTEKDLWENGILDWDAVTRSSPTGLSPKRSEAFRRYLRESRNHLRNQDPRYFADRLPANLQWRLFPEFRSETAYLDIETTGLDGYYSEITVIGLYDGASVAYYIKGQNLDDFRHDVEKYKVIITYNGKCFDIPFIRNRMGLPMDHAHIDLRYVLASFGYRGGLKGCERAVGIDRGALAGLDGYDAVLLWYDYEQNGNQKALETLLSYNGQDIVNLETLMVMAYNQSLVNTPFLNMNQIPHPIAPAIPFQADPEAVERLRFHKSSVSTQGFF